MNFRFPSPLFSTSWSAFRVYIYVLTFEMWIYDQFYAKRYVCAHYDPFAALERVTRTFLSDVTWPAFRLHTGDGADNEDEDEDDSVSRLPSPEDDASDGCSVNAA